MNETAEVKPKAWYTKPRNIAIMFVSLVFLILILQNMESVMVQILFWKASAPAALIYVIFALAGFGAARITLRPRAKKSKGESK